MCDVKVKLIKLKGGTAAPPPRGSGQRSWTQGRAQHDRRGNIQGNGWRLRRSGHAEFSLPRGRVERVARATPSFIQSTFSSHAAFFGTFLGSKKVPSSPSPPRPPPPPLPIKKASPRLSGPASLQYEILAGKAAHYSALSTYMATNSTLSTYISAGTSLTLPRHTLMMV